MCLASEEYRENSMKNTKVIRDLSTPKGAEQSNAV
jgi:hypothetical protein